MKILILGGAGFLGNNLVRRCLRDKNNVVTVVDSLDPRFKSSFDNLKGTINAVEFIQDKRPAGPLFNSYNWGGYLIFKLWSEYPTYIDGRTDLYDDTFIRRYLNVMVAGDDWQQTLDDDGINLIFIESGSVLAKFLRQDANWSEIYGDDKATLFECSMQTLISHAFRQ